MENTKDTTMAGKSLNGHDSTDQGLPNNEGRFHMKRDYNINEEWTKSPLRKGRYQFMKDRLQSKGVFILRLTLRAINEFEGWTREQIEQALDDVMLCGYGEVYSYLPDGGIVIKFIDKDKKGQDSGRA